MLALTYVVRENLPKDVLGLIADTYGFINYIAVQADKLDPDERAFIHDDLKEIKKRVDEIAGSELAAIHPELATEALVDIQAELEVLLQTVKERLKEIGAEEDL